MTKTPAHSTIEKAIGILDGLIGIARHEQLAQVGYFDPDITRPDLAEQGAICGGHKACYVGSMWLAGGVKRRSYYNSDLLPGVTQGSRDKFLARRPALRLAYDAANVAAERYMQRAGIPFEAVPGADRFDAAAEHLFEIGIRGKEAKRFLGLSRTRRAIPEDVVRREMIKVTRAAQRSLRAQLAQAEATA